MLLVIENHQKYQDEPKLNHNDSVISRKIYDYTAHFKIKQALENNLNVIFVKLFYLNQDVLKRIHKIWILLPESQLKYLKDVEISSCLTRYFDPKHKYLELEKVIRNLIEDAEYLNIDENKIEPKRNILKDNDVAFFVVIK